MGGRLKVPLKGELSSLWRPIYEVSSLPKNGLNTSGMVFLSAPKEGLLPTDRPLPEPPAESGGHFSLSSGVGWTTMEVGGGTCWVVSGVGHGVADVGGKLSVGSGCGRGVSTGGSAVPSLPGMGQAGVGGLGVGSGSG